MGNMLHAQINIAEINEEFMSFQGQKGPVEHWGTSPSFFVVQEYIAKFYKTKLVMKKRKLFATMRSGKIGFLLNRCVQFFGVTIVFYPKVPVLKAS